MMTNIVAGIIQQIHAFDPNAICYYNPIRDIQPHSFVLNLIDGAMEQEPNEVTRCSFEWNLYYIGKEYLENPGYASDQRILNGQNIFWNLYPYLQSIPVKGFYNRTEKKENQTVWIPTYNLSMTTQMDLIHCFFSMEFRTRWISESTLGEGNDIEEWELVTQIK